jgi:hypothetical protein
MTLRFSKQQLNVVDINSRKAWSERLPSKGAADVTSAMRKIFNDIQSDGKVVKNLNTDSGKEFLNKDFKNLLDTFFDSPIEHFSSNPKDFAKNGIVERFNRTMRRRVESFVKKIGPNWMSAVPNIMETYNNDPHGTTKEKPDDIWSGGKTSRQQLPRKVRYNLAIGDSDCWIQIFGGRRWRVVAHVPFFRSDFSIGLLWGLGD